MPRQSANSNSYKTTPERNLQRIALISRKNKPPKVSHAGMAAGCGNETKLAYGSSLVKFGAGLSLPGGIVIAIAPTVPFAELLEQQNEERIMRVYEDHRIGGAACRVLTDDPGSLRVPAHIPRNCSAVDRLQ